MPAPFVSHWTLDEGLSVVRDLEAKLSTQLGVHFALAGSVLLRGTSAHDLDVVVFPHCSVSAIDVGKLRAALRRLGWRIRGYVEFVHEEWEKKGSADRKHVEIWATPDRKRVDIIVPTVSYPAVDFDEVPEDGLDEDDDA